MHKRLQKDLIPIFDPARYGGPKPGDFPVGSVQSRAAARAMVDSYKEELRKIEADLLASLPPIAKVQIEDCNNPFVRIYMLLLDRVAQERALVYERPLPSFTPEQIRHRVALHKEIDLMTQGQSSSIQTSSMVEWHRLEAIAEENLRAKKK